MTPSGFSQLSLQQKPWTFPEQASETVWHQTVEAHIRQVSISILGTLCRVSHA